MRLVDSDDGDALSRLVGAVCAEFHGARIVNCAPKLGRAKS